MSFSLPLAELRALFRSCPAFRRVFLADAIAQLGDGGLLVALPMLLVTRTHDVGLAGLAFGGEILAFGLLSPFAGLLADRMEQRWLMLAANSARVALFAVMLLGLQFAAPTWSFLLVSFALGAAGAFFVPARTAFVRRLLDGEALERAIALEGTTGFLLRLVSPSLMGLLLTVVSPSVGIVIDMAAYALAVALLAPAWVTGRAMSAVASQPRGAWREGWQAIGASPALRRLLAFDVVLSGVGTAAFALTVALLDEALRLPPSANAWLLATTGLAGALGTTLARRLGRSSRAILGLTAVVAIAYALVPLAGTLGALMACWSLRGLAIGAFCVIANQRIAAEVPAHLSGRVQAAWGLAVCLAAFSGCASTPWLLHHLGAAHAYGLFAVMLGGLVSSAASADLLARKHGVVWGDRGLEPG